MEELRNVVHIVIPIVMAIAWLIRLEAKVMYLEKKQEENKESEKNMWSKINDLTTSINLIMQSLARIEENIKNIKDNH